MSSEIWWTAPAESEDGRTIMVSGRDNLEKQMMSGKYTCRIEIRWPYAPSPAGMPDTETAKLMEQADIALREALKKDKACILTGVYTGAGQRVWVVYTKNPHIFQAVVNRAWADLPLLPVSFYAEQDADWAEYREMREATYIPDAD